MPLPQFHLFGSGPGNPSAGQRPSTTTPQGWVPVAYRNAQISVPSDWNVAYGTACTTAKAPGSVFVGAENAHCPQRIGGKAVAAVFLGPITPIHGHLGSPQTINGLVVRRVLGNVQGTEYAVPSLGVLLNLVGAKTQGVLKTLTYSPRAVVLASGTAPAVPASWQWVSVDGLRFAVPGNWPVQSMSGYGSGCTATPGARFAVYPSVLLSTDEQPEVPGCVILPLALAPPADGVRVDAVPDRASPTPTGIAAHCLEEGRLTACPYDSPALGILYLRVSGPGMSHSAMLELGLAGSGATARMILHSLRSNDAASTRTARRVKNAVASAERGYFLGSARGSPVVSYVVVSSPNKAYRYLMGLSWSNEFYSTRDCHCAIAQNQAESESGSTSAELSLIPYEEGPVALVEISGVTLRDLSTLLGPPRCPQKHCKPYIPTAFQAPVAFLVVNLNDGETTGGMIATPPDHKSSFSLGGLGRETSEPGPNAFGRRPTFRFKVVVVDTPHMTGQ
ncbi:MAG: hypothetical protein ABSG36_18555 [Acidimicrobiales bacterium]